MKVSLAVCLTKTSIGDYVHLESVSVNPLIRLKMLSAEERSYWYPVDLNLDGRKLNFTKDDVLAAMANAGLIKCVYQTIYGGMYQDKHLDIKHQCSIDTKVVEPGAIVFKRKELAA